MAMPRKTHLLRPNDAITMCGKPRGVVTTNPDQVTCTGCKESYKANLNWYNNHLKP